MQINKEKIAFFDFCGTLVPFQSAPAFISFTVRNYGNVINRIRKKICTLLLITKILDKIEIISRGKYLRKEMELYPLKGISKEKLVESASAFYRLVIKPSLVPEVIAELQKLRLEGFKVVIVSGGYSIYLNHFVSEYNLDKLYSSQIQIIKGYATGLLDGLDCMGVNKVKLVEKDFRKEDIYSVFYSDSESDMPLLKWVNKGFLIEPIDGIRKMVIKEL